MIKNEEVLLLDEAAYLIVETSSKNQGGGLEVSIGDNVIVYGKAVSTNTISTCDSGRYYIDTGLSLPK